MNDFLSPEQLYNYAGDSITVLRKSNLCPFCSRQAERRRLRRPLVSILPTLQPAQKKAQREPHLYSADHAVILGLANTLRATAEHHKMLSIKQSVCEGEV